MTADGQNRQLAEIIDGIPGIVWMASRDPGATGQPIDFVSPYVETMLGYSVQEWLSTPNFWLSIVHPDDRARAASVGRGGIHHRRPAQQPVPMDHEGRPDTLGGIARDRR